MSHDECFEHLNKGLYDSFLSCKFMIGNTVVHEIYIPIRFVEFIMKTDVFSLNEFINYILNEIHKYTDIKVRFFLKEGNKRDRLQVESVVRKEQIVKITPLVGLENFMLTLMEKVTKEMLYALIK